MIKRENYLDYAATTPLHPEVFEKMQLFFSEAYGNPSSAHALGQQAYRAVEDSREQIAAHFGLTNPDLVLFTGSSTEACNLVLFSAIIDSWRKAGERCHVLISALEHNAVRETVFSLQSLGFCMVDIVPVDKNGLTDPQEVAKRIQKNTAIVSIIFGNNEIGTINSISEIGAKCRERGVLFHSDTTQYAAHALFDFAQMPVDYMTIAAHKCYGPKGIGAALIHPLARNTPLIPLISGGKQEKGRRAGTHNVPYIIGMAEAYSLLAKTAAERFEHESTLRNLLIKRIINSIPDTLLTGSAEHRLTNHASFSFKDIDSLMLQSIIDQRGFAVSIGSACRSNQRHGQQQLIELGLGDEWINGGLRVTTGLFNTESSIIDFCETLSEVVAELRKRRHDG